MTLKAAMDEDGVAAETMADRLRAVQTESWRKMEWVHDEDEAAWEAYNECLLLKSQDALAGRDPDSKGKGLDTEEAGTADDSGAPDLVNKVPRLQTEWGEDELLRAVSGIKRHDKKPGEEAVERALGTSTATKSDPKGKGKVQETASVEPVTEARGRTGRPAASASVPKRGSRVRGLSRGGGSSAVNAMQID